MEYSFEQPGSGDPTPVGPDCPPVSVWYEIAGGVTAPERAYALLEHASSCGHCAALFREAVSDLNEETTAAEGKELASLPSATLEWQRGLVRQITGKAGHEPITLRRRWFTIPRLALAAAGVSAVAIAIWVASLPSPLERTGKLLAKAHVQKRTLQMRMSGMPYAPAGEGMQRRDERSFLDRPDTLLQAEALIAKHLAHNPSDPQWLQAKGRADLMEGKYQGALESLRRASQLAPKSAEISTDLAIASYQLGDYAGAYEKLGDVLVLKPDDPMALFNRAIVGNELHLYQQVLEDTSRYLRIDPQSKWSDEIRDLADRARLNLQQQERKQKISLLTPAQLVEAANDATRLAEVDERVEAYLKEAVVSWLPRAYPDRGTTPDPAARQALFFLANLTGQRHNDHWLADLLQGASAASFPRGIRALALAAQANATSDFDVADSQTTTATEIFRQSQNHAGELRARFERIFSAQLERESERCRRESPSAAAAAERYSYSWLEIQFQLEQGLCSALMGDLGTYGSLAMRAQEGATRAGYGDLYLRSTTFAADARQTVGMSAEKIQLVNDGLKRFWSGNFQPLRGYSLYSELAVAAEGTDRPKLRYAAWVEAIRLNDSDQDVLRRATAHRALADAAISAGLPEVAQLQYAEAGRLYAVAPSRKAAHNYALENEISTARLEAHLGNFDAAIRRLMVIQDDMRSISNNFLVQLFYSTLGELELGRHRPMEAERALRPALALAERNLASIHSQAERIHWSESAAPLYLALTQAELEQGRTQESLETYEWFLGASRGDVSKRFRTESLKQAVAIVPRDLSSRLPLLSEDTVIAYGLLPGGLAIWVYDNRGVHVRWDPKPNEPLEELVSRFHEMVSDAASDVNALRRDSRSLYAALIVPVESQLAEGRTLIIEAEGPLASLPFEALLDGKGHYLIERQPIVHSSGERAEGKLHRGDILSPDWPALIVGSTAAQPSEGILALPNVAAEADAVAGGFRSARLLKGEEATLNAVRSALPEVKLFHFAGHSLSSPDRVGLLLADQAGRGGSSLLDADAVRRVHLSTLQLAVLSACSTGSAGTGAEGFNSMTEAFLHGGVPHVVASRWAVDSVAARSYVQDFYRNALSGLPVSESTRLTSLRMLSDPRTSHPYFWAAFAAYGKP